MHEVRRDWENAASPMVVGGCVGPRGDGYVLEQAMRADEAEAYHREQIGVLAAAGADMINALTLTSSAEAIGVARAAAKCGLAAAVAFTVETDGRLPSGEPLGEAIEAVDAATGAAPAYFMVNCAHPSHFAAVIAAALGRGEAWPARLGGVRVNASRRSHAELDALETLDDGDPGELGADVAALRRRLPSLTVLGGCCGADHRHIERICLAARHTASAAA
jgi:S-methylmethionine-dependent homocysteine/selenocysteine methylase